MEKLQKYYLKLFVVLTLLSCRENDYSKLSIEERKNLSIKVLEDGNHLYQGSPESMTLIERAIKIDSSNCDAVRELSVAYLKRGLPQKWKKQFDKAVACNASIWQPMRGYLYLYFYRDYKKAIADFNASDTLTPSFIDAPQGHSVDYWRGIAYLGLHNYEKSNWYMEKHIAKETEEFGEDYVDLTAFLYNGISYYEVGNYKKALYNFNKNLQYSRNKSADAKYYKALIYKEQNEIEQAEKQIEEAILDFNNGAFNSYHYVEVIRQIYDEDLQELKDELYKFNFKS